MRERKNERKGRGEKERKKGGKKEREKRKKEKREEEKESMRERKKDEGRREKGREGKKEKKKEKERRRRERERERRKETKEGRKERKKGGKERKRKRKNKKGGGKEKERKKERKEGKKQRKREGGRERERKRKKEKERKKERVTGVYMNMHSAICASPPLTQRELRAHCKHKLHLRAAVINMNQLPSNLNYDHTITGNAPKVVTVKNGHESHFSVHPPAQEETLDQFRQVAIQSLLENLQGWSTHSFWWQAVPLANCTPLLPIPQRIIATLRDSNQNHVGIAKAELRVVEKKVEKKMASKLCPPEEEGELHAFHIPKEGRKEQRLVARWLIRHPPLNLQVDGQVILSFSDRSELWPR
ncbi:Histone-lysine N-methyltransferase, H3 lysine-79 specific, partial [Ophiophagus hannah]